MPVILGGEAEDGHLGIDAKDLGGAGRLHSHLRQLLGGGDHHVAVFVHGVLVVNVDGAVAHGQLFLAPDQDEAGGHQVSPSLGLHQLQSRADGISSGVCGAAQQGIGVTHLHQHGAKVIALGQRFPAILSGHLALAEGNHLLHHGVHLRVSSRVDDLDAFHVKVPGGGSSLDRLHLTNENRGQEAAFFQPVRGLQNSGIGAFGKDNFPGIRFQDFNHRIKHFRILHVMYFRGRGLPRFIKFIILRIQQVYKGYF